MLPVLLLALERHGRLTLGKNERELILSVSTPTIDRLLMGVKIAAAGGRRRCVGIYSAIRREVPIRTFNDWSDPPPGYCEIDMVAHGGMSVAGSFIQTLTMVDIATGWTECLPLVARDGSFVVEAMTRAQRSQLVENASLLLSPRRSAAICHRHQYLAPCAHADPVRHRAPPTRFGDAALVIGADSSVTFSVRQCAPFLE
jgi:hypothetical protein